MKASACGRHTTQLTRLGLSNCYLVSEDDGLTLIDTSLRGSAAQILDAAARLGQPIRRIALTHAHHESCLVAGLGSDGAGAAASGQAARVWSGPVPVNGP